MNRRAPLLVLAIGVCACRTKPAPTEGAPAPSPKASASAAQSVPQAASASPVVSPPAALVKSLDAWNAATNAGDAEALKRLYAEQLSLYERLARRSEAARRKQEYVATHRGFSQTLEAVVWQNQGERYAARFRKTSSSEETPPSTVDAFLVFAEKGGEWLIVDEGDVQTTRKISAGLEAHRENWKPRTWTCVGCDDPEYGDDPPIARAPLGPDTVRASGPIPPGAPAVVEYGRAMFPRFASAADVPLFLTATPQSANGDGRWFYYEDPRPEMRAEGRERHLLYCAIGGMFTYGPPPENAKPDPGHVGEPLIRSRSLYERRDGELYYERYLYGADGVENFVYCTFDPAYEAYFYAIVERIGRSMRAISGGQAERPYRASQPFTVE